MHLLGAGSKPMASLFVRMKYCVEYVETDLFEAHPNFDSVCGKKIIFCGVESPEASILNRNKIFFTLEEAQLVDCNCGCLVRYDFGSQIGVFGLTVSSLDQCIGWTV